MSTVKTKAYVQLFLDKMARYLEGAAFSKSRSADHCVELTMEAIKAKNVNCFVWEDPNDILFPRKVCVPNVCGYTLVVTETMYAFNLETEDVIFCSGI